MFNKAKKYLYDLFVGNAKELDRLRNKQFQSESEIRSLRSDIHMLRGMIKDVTTLHADIAPHAKADNYVILIGRYRNNDYVRVASLPSGSFAETVDRMKHLSKVSEVKYLDMPPTMSVAFKREMDRW